MHTFNETGAGVPAFLAKLWRLVDDPETNNLICWSKDGRSFIIQNQAQFARELLPLNYKHNNMASFIRQLNMYGFHKITSIDNGGLKFDRDEMEFSHPCFKRNCPYLLEHIKRKIANTKSIDEKSALKPEAVSKVLQDVKAMRGRQDSLDSRFSVMKQENEALWREIASLRQKHAKQQQIVNKLIQFLITIVQPSRNMTSVKRHMQLMINDTPENAKMRKNSESESDRGPVIHELGEELLDEVNEDELDMIDSNSPYNPQSVNPENMGSPSPSHVERPHSSISMLSQNYDYSNQSADDVLNAVAAAGLAAPVATPHTAGNGGAAAAHLPSSIIQSVNPDGSKIVYHVTEVPDAHPADNSQASPANYNDDNVLTTPLVRQQMARSQQLKQKNKQRRNKMEVISLGTLTSNVESAVPPSSSNGGDPASPSAKLKRQNQAAVNVALNNEKMHIKSEKELDPMLFLNVYPETGMVSSNLSEDSRPASVGKVAPTPNDAAQNELYNSSDFLASSMPSDIFEDSSMIGGGENSNLSDNYKPNTQQQLLLQQQLQQQFGLNTATSGKFSSFLAGNNANCASTSAAAAAAAASTSTAANNRATSQGKNGNAMAVAKYKTNGNGSSNNEEVARDDLHGHLDNVQDELDSLKDLLRGDGYSLDANTLLGNGSTSSTINNRLYLGQPLDGDFCFLNKLFNDSDILGPYGLAFSNENSGEKKGSELMTYQPIYDLSDIIDINDKAELDDASSIGTSTSSQLPPPPNSVLNTPYHE